MKLKELAADRVRTEVGIRVGLLIGRYIGDFDMVAAVVENVAAGWLAHRQQEGDACNLEGWWSRYVEAVESTVGGVDCADDERLAWAWTAHARRLMRG